MGTMGKGGCTNRRGTTTRPLSDNSCLAPAGSKPLAAGRQAGSQAGGQQAYVISCVSAMCTVSKLWKKETL